jgi:DNA-directed RNA polymerase subunit RPC12/RpoP
MTMHITLAEAQTAYLCPDCDDVIEEPVALYECGECGTIFSRATSANDNHQCPDCNKFASKLTAHGCPDCEVELEVVKAIEGAGDWIVLDDAA